MIFIEAGVECRMRG